MPAMSSKELLISEKRNTEGGETSRLTPELLLLSLDSFETQALTACTRALHTGQNKKDFKVELNDLYF